jgi:hypothetical protein
VPDPACLSTAFRGAHSGAGCSVASRAFAFKSPWRPPSAPSSPSQPPISCARVHVACESAAQRPRRKQIYRRRHRATLAPTSPALSRAQLFSVALPVSVAPTYVLLPLTKVHIAKLSRLQDHRAGSANQWHTGQAYPSIAVLTRSSNPKQRRELWIPPLVKLAFLIRISCLDHAISLWKRYKSPSTPSVQAFILSWPHTSPKTTPPNRSPKQTPDLLLYAHDPPSSKNAVQIPRASRRGRSDPQERKLHLPGRRPPRPILAIALFHHHNIFLVAELRVVSTTSQDQHQVALLPKAKGQVAIPSLDLFEEG